MHAVVELLSLLFPLLRRLDAPLAAHLEEAGLGEGPPIFALAWLITWFAHGVSALPTAARLFDAFLASHPLLPLYAAAAAMKARCQVVRQPLAYWEVSPAHAGLFNGAEMKHFTLLCTAQQRSVCFGSAHAVAAACERSCALCGPCLPCLQQPWSKHAHHTRSAWPETCKLHAMTGAHRRCARRCWRRAIAPSCPGSWQCPLSLQ